MAQSGLDLPRLLRNLRLLHELDGEQTLSVAALLVFGEAPQRWLPHSRLSAVSSRQSAVSSRRSAVGGGAIDRLARGGYNDVEQS